MPHAEPLPIIGARCGAIRVRDEGHNWRIMYRIDSDAVLIVEVYAKTTRTIPSEVIDSCKKRLDAYDEVAKRQARRAQGTPKPK
jgi:phage-related protein